MTSCSSQTPFAWPLSARQYARSLSLSQLFKFAEPLLGSWSDLYKKETWFLVSGTCLYDNKEFDAGVSFGFSGQVTNPTKPILSVFDLLCTTLKLEKPDVHTGRNPPF
jgi:hypothetical protein